MQATKALAIILLVTLIIIFSVGYDTKSFEVEIVDNGELLGYKGFNVIDTGVQYKKGQVYTVKYRSFIYHTFNRSIELKEE